MSSLAINPINDVWVQIDCEESTARELSDYFSFVVPNARYMPQMRGRNWDGKIRLFKLRGHLIYRGLVPRVYEFASQHGYTVDNRVPDVEPVSFDVSAWLRTVSLPVEIRDYQQLAVETLLQQHRGVVVSPTGSGKSLIIHLLADAIHQPTLIVVPTTGLVSQLAHDLESYGCPSTDIQRVHAGLPKAQQSRIVLSTWQSIYKLPESYFAQFQCVMVDEVHLAKSKSLTHLLEKCTTVPYRFGFTGTLDGTQAHQLILEGLFGAVTHVTNTHALMQQAHLARLRVKMCVLKYSDVQCRATRQLPYPDEVETIISDPCRLRAVAELALRASGNVLVLFNFVEKHGRPLHALIQDRATDQHVHFISGDTSASEREAIRQHVNSGTGRHIMVASYGTTSTGINIPAIHYIIFASPSKSKIRVLQSIGRSLRLHASKTHATLIDIVDDLRCGRYVNHTFRHAEQRAQYYAAEKFPFTVVEYPLSHFASDA